MVVLRGLINTTFESFCWFSKIDTKKVVLSSRPELPDACFDLNCTLGCWDFELCKHCVPQLPQESNKHRVSQSSAKHLTTVRTQGGQCVYGHNLPHYNNQPPSEGSSSGCSSENTHRIKKRYELSLQSKLGPWEQTDNRDSLQNIIYVHAMTNWRLLKRTHVKICLFHSRHFDS